MILDSPKSVRAPESPELSDEAAWQLSNQLILTVKLLARVRSESPQPVAGVDLNAYPVLFCIAHGRRRISDVAAAVHSDVSTVSRHVTGLAQHGLVEKLPDESDRRVQVVTLTDHGQDLIDQLAEQRATWFRRVLADWPAEDIEAFRVYLQRFAADVESLAPELAPAP